MFVSNIFFIIKHLSVDGDPAMPCDRGLTDRSLTYGILPNTGVDDHVISGRLQEFIEQERSVPAMLGLEHALYAEPRMDEVSYGILIAGILFFMLRQ